MQSQNKLFEAMHWYLVLLMKKPNMEKKSGGHCYRSYEIVVLLSISKQHSQSGIDNFESQMQFQMESEYSYKGLFNLGFSKDSENTSVSWVSSRLQRQGYKSPLWDFFTLQNFFIIVPDDKQV